MNRSELAGLALMPALLYASAVAVGDVGIADVPSALGFLAAVLPAAALVRREWAIVAWAPGIFLGVLLFTVTGLVALDVPGPLGPLAGGWAMGSPIFLGLGALAARGSPGARAFLGLLALLASVGVLGIAAHGVTGGAGPFALAFGGLPRAQALALAVVLTGGVPASVPLDPTLPELFLPLALLSGAGILSGLLAVESGERIEALGFEGPPAKVPEGTYRSLFPEGRGRLREATAPARPAAPELEALAALGIAVSAGVVSLVVAVERPGLLLLGTSVAVVAALFATAVRSYFPSAEPEAALPPTPASNGPSAPAPDPDPARRATRT